MWIRQNLISGIDCIRERSTAAARLQGIQGGHKYSWPDAMDALADVWDWG